MTLWNIWGADQKCLISYAADRLGGRVGRRTLDHVSPMCEIGQKHFGEAYANMAHCRHWTGTYQGIREENPPPRTLVEGVVAIA